MNGSPPSPQAAGARINVLPVDLGRVFPVSGGLPLAKRAPQRQAYRLVELKRFSEFLGRPLHLQPRYFPVGTRRRGQAHHRRRSARRHRRGDAHRRRDLARRLGRAAQHRRPDRAAGYARRDAAWRRAVSTTRRRRPCTSATRATRSAPSTPAFSARRPTSSRASCSGARTGSISSSGASPAG